MTKRMQAMNWFYYEPTEENLEILHKYIEQAVQSGWMMERDAKFVLKKCREYLEEMDDV